MTAKLCHQFLAFHNFRPLSGNECYYNFYKKEREPINPPLSLPLIQPALALRAYPDQLITRFEAYQLSI